METNKKIKQNLKDVNFEAKVELDHNKAKRKREEESINPIKRRKVMI